MGGSSKFLQRTHKPQRIVGIGEAMVEFAPLSGGLFKRGFAGDTLNTSWYLRRLLPESLQVSYATRVGTDAISNEFVSFVEQAGIESDTISRDPERTLGLYTISLEGAERRFSYWRETSAARRLADNAEQLARSLSDAALVYVSGITLAVIGESGRENLSAALKRARKTGTRVVFDSNIRLRLWPNETVARSAIERFLALTDVALPSFDDEANIWKDRSPESTVKRLRDSDVVEIVVKNGAGIATVFAEGTTTTVNAKSVSDALDTTAAGDSFNAAYLAARCMGHAPVIACKLAHELAGEVVRHPGALVPREVIEPVKQLITNVNEIAQ
jgi:2-dehydro-3-deoxygluconokinase